MISIMKLESFIEAILLRCTDFYPELISVLHVVGRVDLLFVHHQLCMLTRNHVNVGECRGHCDALAVVAQVEIESKL